MNDSVLFFEESNHEEIEDPLNSLSTNHNSNLYNPAIEVQSGKRQLNIAEQIKIENTYEASNKNSTLFKVIQDNKKVLKRKFQPLLQMFNVESLFFKQIQEVCR